MTYQFLKLVHLLSLFVWVGGMIFSHGFLRKPLADLPSNHRFAFMYQVLRRFFNAVSVAAVLVLLTGLWMIGRMAKQVARAGGTFEMPWSWTVMAVLGVIMMVVFVYLRSLPYRRLRAALARNDWERAALALSAIRRWVAFNLSLGLFIIVVTMLG